MSISNHLLTKACNRHHVTPAWATLGDWLEVLAHNTLATPLIDFGHSAKYRVGVTSLNWYVMDLLGLRAEWLEYGWNSREDKWLLINPLRYRLLGYQPKRPFAYDVRDYLLEHYATYLGKTLAQLPYFALAPTIHRDELDDQAAERYAASSAPWCRVAVVDDKNDIIGMVWGTGPMAGNIPPIMNRFEQTNF